MHGELPTDFDMRWASCIYGCSVAPLSLCCLASIPDKTRGNDVFTKGWCLPACVPIDHLTRTLLVNGIEPLSELSPRQQLPRLSRRHHSSMCMQMRSDWVAFCLCAACASLCGCTIGWLHVSVSVDTCAVINGGGERVCLWRTPMTKGGLGYKVDRHKIWHRS